MLLSISLGARLGLGGPHGGRKQIDHIDANKEPFLLLVHFSVIILLNVHSIPFRLYLTNSLAVIRSQYIEDCGQFNMHYIMSNR